MQLIDIFKDKEMVFVGLADCDLGSDYARAVADYIYISASLTDIDLSYNNLTDDGKDMSGVEVIASAICVSASLTSIDVRTKTFLAEETAVQLSNVVLRKAAVERFNQISTKDLRSDSLTELDFSGSKNIGVDGAMVLAGLLPITASLTAINLNHGGISLEGGKAIAKAISVSASLTSIDLGGN